MLKIIEIRETIEDTKLIDNIYDIQKIIRKIINNTEFLLEINKDEYEYINITLEKTKINLQKVYGLMEYSFKNL